MKRVVLFSVIFLGAACAYADSNKGADCYINYVIDLSANKKYCLPETKKEDPMPIIIQGEIQDVPEVPTQRTEHEEWMPFIDATSPIEPEPETPTDSSSEFEKGGN